MENLVLEAHVEGQLGAVDLQQNGDAVDVFADYFVPNGEDRPLGSLSTARRARYSPVRRAIELLRDLAT
jgi:inosine/xanthosine triphosphate pyrophosphatase family protein